MRQIEFHEQYGVGVLTIARPEKRNAMSADMIDTFMNHIERAGRDPALRALVITGAGGVFCAGVDLAELAAAAEAPRLPDGGDRDRWWPIVQCPKPVIAAVDGMAVGMGAEITLQCDLRIATPTARFSWNFAQRGLVPDSAAGTWLLPRLIGYHRALKLLYTGDWLEAGDARVLGYVEEVVAADSLMERAMELAQSVARASPFAIRRIKTLVYGGLGAGSDEHVARSVRALQECLVSDEHREAVRAFVERRPPRFT